MLWKNCERKIDMETLQAQLLEAQLAIGKAVLESMLVFAPNKDTMKLIIPMTYEDKEFEIEVRLKGC